MVAIYHLIDGYNLLHAAGLARATYGPGDLERARFALLTRIADGSGDVDRERITIVFDAADPPPDAERHIPFRGMTVLYAVEYAEADALIEELIRRHSSPRQLRVVSDDIRLQRAAKRRGARAVKCDRYLNRLDRQASPSQPLGDDRQSREAEEPAANVEDWLDFFGVADETNLVPDAPEISVRPTDPSSVRPSSPIVRKPVGHAEPERESPDSAQGRLEDDDVPTGQSVEFWQRRIDEAVDDECRGGEARPS